MNNYCERLSCVSVIELWIGTFYLADLHRADEMNNLNNLVTNMAETVKHAVHRVLKEKWPKIKQAPGESRRYGM